VALVLLSVLAGAPHGEAHALLQRAVPGADESVARAPAAVVLTFTEPPDPQLSSVQVLDAGGRPVGTGSAQPLRGDPVTLLAPLPALPVGVYTVTWRTVSLTDGHVAAGAFAFAVGVPAPSAPVAQPHNPPPSLLYVLSRVLLYTGLLALLAGAIAAGWSAGPSRGSAALLLPKIVLGWGAAAVGLVLLAVAEARDAGTSVAALLRTPLGHALAWRAAPVAAVLPALWTAGRRGKTRTLGVVLGALAAAAMLTHVIWGHAAAGPQAWRWWDIAVQWLHFVAVGAWTVAVITVRATALRHGDAAAADRASIGAAVALAALVATGALRSASEIGSWSALWSTETGRLVLVKLTLLVPLALLGAWSHRWIVRRPGAERQRGRAVAAAQAVIVLAALTATAILTGLALPAARGPAGGPAAGIVVTGSDYATSVRLRLQIDPGRAGVNRFTAEISDYDTGRPVTGARVSLGFTMPERPDIGRSNLTLSRRGDGRYAAAGPNLPIEGAWSVVALIQRPAQSTEVRLQVTLPAGAVAIRRIEAPGKPPVYSVPLSGGRSLTLYLDPGKPGFNSLHGTFADAQGRELDLARVPDVSIGRPGQAAQPLPVFREGPGHFAADAEVESGDWQFEIVGVTRTGETIRTRLTVHL
jgi:copper transport protein